MAADVTLRETIESDLPILYEQQLDPLATEMAAFPAREHDAFMAHKRKVLANPDNILRTIVADGAVAGNIGSWSVDGEREVGYWLGREYWGKGIATAALAAMLDVVRERPLYAYVAAHNTGSRRVLEKNGFTVLSTGNIAADGVEEIILILR